MSRLSNESGLPDGWRSLQLSEVASERIVYGIVQAGPHDPTGVPYLKSSDVGGVIVTEGLQRTSSAIHAKFGRSKVVPGNIVISLRGNIGATSVVPPDLGEANLTQGTARIAVSKEHSSEFVRQQIAGASTQRLIQAATKGSTFVEITLDDLRKVEILCPPPQEQRRIADILSTWDRAIETVDALTTNAREQKRALMQALLTGRSRLPGFSDEWMGLRLGQAFAERLERGDDDLALLSVTQSSGIIPQEDAGRRNISSADQSNYKTVRAGDIAYNTMRMWQGASAVSSLTGKVSPAYTVVTPREGHDAGFYGYLFKKPEMIHIFERHSQGLVSDTWNLKFPLFAAIRICVPGFEEQRAIAKIIRVADNLIRQRQAQLDALRQEKAALMQQLLTGKRRVRVAESEAA